MIGVNGLCSVYDPPVSYWCSEHPSGGGAFAFRTPTGVVATPQTLPNSPYKDASDIEFFVWRPARWASKNAFPPRICSTILTDRFVALLFEGGTKQPISDRPLGTVACCSRFLLTCALPMTSLHSKANWMFEVSNYDKASGNFSFGKGGNQGARGSNSGGDFFVENVMEELDFPSEFFYDKSSSQLYFYYNGTGAPPASTTFVVPQKRILLNMSGTQVSLKPLQLALQHFRMRMTPSMA